MQGKYRPKFSLGDGPKSVLPGLGGETWYCIPLWHSGAAMALGTRYADIGYLLTYYVPFSINPGIGLATRSGIIGGGDWEITIQPDKKFDPEFLLVNYYDDYSFIGTNGVPASLAYAAPPSGYGVRYTGGSKGLLTGTVTARLDASGVAGYDYTAYYYDDRGRIVQTRSTNALGGTDIEYVAYNFVGDPMKRRRVHTATGKPGQTEVYSYTYDHAGRLLTTKCIFRGIPVHFLAAY